MDAENQAHVKNIAEDSSKKGSANNIIVVLGASDIEGALISAETVTAGDPSFTGPLAGVSLGLPVYHILEQEMREAIPEDVYEENVGIWALAVDTEEIGKEFRAIRDKNARDGGSHEP
jgi:glycine reductase